MTRTASDFEPDETVAEDRRPTNCPFCGYSGAFDGHGYSHRTMTVQDADERATFHVVWFKARCGECNGHFQMLDEAGKVEE